MLKAIPKAIGKTFNRFTLDGVAIVGLTLFFFISLSLLLYAAGMSLSEGIKDTFTAFMGVLAAIATLWAAHSASLSAKAARDSADQWKNQMVFEKRISAGLELISAMHEWRHLINLARWTSLEDLKYTVLGERVSPELVSRLQTTVKSEIKIINTAYSNLATKSDLARILGLYDEESELRIKALHQKFYKSLLTVDKYISSSNPSALVSTRYSSDVLIASYHAGKDGSYDSELLEAWRDFEIRYRAQLVKMGGEGFDMSVEGRA